MKRFIQYPLRGNADFVLAHLKTDITRKKMSDIPCFQFSAYLPGERARMRDLKELLVAVIEAGDWADETTRSLSDHYPAQHNIAQTQFIRRRNGDLYVPIAGSSKIGITITKDGEVYVPKVWYTEGQTQTQWGRFEAAIRCAIKAGGG